MSSYSRKPWNYMVVRKWASSLWELDDWKVFVDTFTDVTVGNLPAWTNLKWMTIANILEQILL